MLQERNIWELAEAYINNELSGDDKAALERRRSTDHSFAAEFQDCIDMLQALKGNAAQKKVRSILKDAHNELETPKAAPKQISNRRHMWRTAAVAASIALITSLTTYWVVQVNNKKIESKYSLLRRDLEKYKRSQNKIIRDIKEQTGSPYSDARYTATGFAITNNGFLATNYHVVEGADSVYIQTQDGEYHKVNVIGGDKTTDLVVLKVEDDNFKFSKYDVPYALARNKKMLGTTVFTLGFPQDEIVYNEGYISAVNGYQGDSTQYRLEIPAGPGQSGAPVVDASGNVIGLITGKQSQSEGITYAVCSEALLSLADSLKGEHKISLPRVNRMGRLSRVRQIERLEQFTCAIKVYKK